MKSLRQGHGGKTPIVPTSRSDQRKRSQGAKRYLTGCLRKAAFERRTRLPKAPYMPHTPHSVLLRAARRFWTFSHTQNRVFHFWRLHTPARRIRFFLGLQKAKTCLTFWGCSAPKPSSRVLGFIPGLSGSYPQFSTKLSTSVWITHAYLWTDVDNRWKSPDFADIAWFLQNAQNWRRGAGLAPMLCTSAPSPS